MNIIETFRGHNEPIVSILSFQSKIDKSSNSYYSHFDKGSSLLTKNENMYIYFCVYMYMIHLYISHITSITLQNLPSQFFFFWIFFLDLPSLLLFCYLTPCDQIEKFQSITQIGMMKKTVLSVLTYHTCVVQVRT